MLLLTPLSTFAIESLVFVTASDTEHYLWTRNLVSGIHRYHENIEEIAVFNLGLTDAEKNALEELAHVHVYEVEKTNPLILEKFQVNANGKIARGLYSWKPVVLKEAACLFPLFFYIDSGITITGDLTPLFAHTEDNGSFLIDCGHDIERMTTKPLVGYFDLKNRDNAHVLKSRGISAGFQGITRSLYSTYIFPLYQMTSEIEFFTDDGSAPKGFGYARHDQTLFSIKARLLNLNVHKALRGEPITLRSKGEKKTVHLSDFIKITRGNFDPQLVEKYLKKKSLTEL
ncbi:MAG: hypothetical protein NTX49_09040 [Chlamydiae bacterium]|nr:hypothetical protein [Chlamydiota bacterium]